MTYSIGWSEERIDQINEVMEKVLEAAGERVEEMLDSPRGYKLSAYVYPVTGVVQGATWGPTVPKNYSVLYEHWEPASLLTVEDVCEQIIEHLGDLVDAPKGNADDDFDDIF